MKIKKKLLCCLMALLVFTTVIFTDYERAEASAVVSGALTIAGAVVTAWGIKEIHEDAYDSYHNGAWNDIQQWCKKNWGPAGFIVSMNTEAEFFDRVLYPALVAKGILSSGDQADQTSYDKLKTYVNNHYTLNQDNSISYDTDMKNLFIGLMNQYISNSGYTYVYTYNAQLSITQITNGIDANQIKGIIEQYQDTYDLVYGQWSAQDSYVIQGYPEGSIIFVKNGNKQNPYNATNWNQITQTFVTNGFCKLVNFRNDNTSNLDRYGDWDFIWTTENNSTFNMKSDYVFAPVTYGKVKIYKLYDSLNVYKSESLGESRYYINSPTYNNYKSSTGDYIMNNDNSNHATYGDIITYNTTYYDENQKYPSPNETEIYIREVEPKPIPTPTPTPGGGGSSGGSGGTTVSTNGVNVVINNNPTASNTNNNTYTDNSTTNNNFFFNLLHGGSVSGNGIGSSVSGNGDDSSGNIFDWLGDLGKVLGNLIKNLGEALLNIIRGITELVESIIIGLPTMFFDFIGAVFGWLPEEWVTLLSLSLACMLIYGIIKIFRG